MNYSKKNHNNQLGYVRQAFSFLSFILLEVLHLFAFMLLMLVIIIVVLFEWLEVMYEELFVNRGDESNTETNQDQTQNTPNSQYRHTDLKVLKMRSFIELREPCMLNRVQINAG